MRTLTTTTGGVAVLMSSSGLLAAAMTLLAGCQKPAEKAAPPPPAVTVAAPIQREVIDYDEYTGKLAATEEVEVHARVKGYIDSIGFKDGDEVKKDQLLFQIDPKPFEEELQAAEGQLATFKATKIRVTADVKRYEELVPKGAATRQDLDRAIGQLGEAEGGIKTAEAAVDRAKLELQYAKVSAPIDGLASKANLTVGNLIGASGAGDQALTTIVKLDPIECYFDVDQRAAQQYRKDAIKRRAGAPEPKTTRELNIKISFGLASEEGFPHEGLVDFIDNKVNATTGTIEVRAEVDNKDRLFRPGYFARIRVAAGEKYQALLVSERAIGTQQGEKYLLVVDEKNTVAFRPVKLGAPQPGGLRVIRSGVKAGEHVIINGMQRARPGSVVKAENGDMQPSQHGAATKPTVTAASR
jgi:RND family efflux transporter MFP subunit